MTTAATLSRERTSRERTSRKMSANQPVRRLVATRLILRGGFLRAGQTTTLLRLARHWTAVASASSPTTRATTSSTPACSGQPRSARPKWLVAISATSSTTSCRQPTTCSPARPRNCALFRLLFQPFLDPRRIASAIQDGANADDLPVQPVVDGKKGSASTAVESSHSTAGESRHRDEGSQHPKRGNRESTRQALRPAPHRNENHQRDPVRPRRGFVPSSRALSDAALGGCLVAELGPSRADTTLPRSQHVGVPRGRGDVGRRASKIIPDRLRRTKLVRNSHPRERYGDSQ
jgi:hypothetical protein